MIKSTIKRGVGAAVMAVSAVAATMLATPVMADDDTLTIAYNVTLPSWDPTVGPSAVNPTIQSI